MRYRKKTDRIDRARKTISPIRLHRAAGIIAGWWSKSAPEGEDLLKKGRKSALGREDPRRMGVKSALEREQNQHF